jgi:hypothetical protein
MDSGLSMSSGAKVTATFAKTYGRPSEKDKRLILDRVMSVTGWSRDNARRRLAQAAKRPGISTTKPLPLLRNSIKVRKA